MWASYTASLKLTLINKISKFYFIEKRFDIRINAAIIFTFSGFSVKNFIDVGHVFSEFLGHGIYSCQNHLICVTFTA